MKKMLELFISVPGLTFRCHYFSFAVLIFTLEVFIALFVRDNFVRPYLGDVLAVVLIYCFFRAFLRVEVVPAAIFVLLFAFTIEWLQYVHIVEKLGWERSKLARTIIGTSFSWGDILAYVVGFAGIFVGEPAWFKQSDSSQ